MGEIFGHNRFEILVFASPTGYMLTSFGFLLLNWGIFISSSKLVGIFHAVLNFNRFICN